MDACTVTAPDAITAFAVPNPDGFSQGSRFFQVWLSGRLPCRTDHPAYFGLATFCEPSFSAVDRRTLCLPTVKVCDGDHKPFQQRRIMCVSVAREPHKEPRREAPGLTSGGILAWRTGARLKLAFTVEALEHRSRAVDTFPSGLVNRSGAPVPFESSLPGVQKSVMSPSPLAQCGKCYLPK